MIQPHNRLPNLVLLLALASCVRTSSGGSEARVAPTNLTYGINTARLVLLVEAPANEPTVEGLVESWAVTPALPIGMELDPQSGTIFGRPEELQESTTYTVTASNHGGETSATVDIGIFGAPLFAYTANSEDDSISMYIVDALSGRLTFNGHLEARPGEVRPEVLDVHPEGRFLYAANSGDGSTNSSISVFEISAENGRLEALPPLPLAGGPLDFVIANDGRHLYASVFGNDELAVLSIDPDTGNLAVVQSYGTGDGPSALTLDPDGEFLWVLNERAGTITTFAVDPNGASLIASAADFFIGGSPSSIAGAPDGEHLYLTFEDSDQLVAFSTDPATGEPARVGAASTGDGPSNVALHPGGEFAYVSDSDSGTLSLFSLVENEGEPASRGDIDAGVLPKHVAFDASGLYAYSISSGTNEIWAYAVDEGDGSLERIGLSRTRRQPSSIALAIGTTPVVQQAANLYVLSNGSGEASTLQVSQSDGVLTESGVPVPVGQDARDLAVDPLGRYAVSVDFMGRLSVFWIDEQSGELSVAWADEPLPGRPRGVDVDPTGRWVYVALRDDDLAMSFEIDLDTGQPLEISTVTTVENPQSANIDPSGRFLYVTHTLSDDIWAWPVREGVIEDAPIVTTGPGNPLELRFSPGGDLAITPLDLSDHIATYSIDPVTGALSVIVPGKAARNSPAAFEVHPNGRYGYAAVHGGVIDDGRVSSYLFDEQTARITEEQKHFESTNPRDLRLDPSGRFLFTADEGSDSVSTFKIDADTGRPTFTGQTTVGSEPRALAIVRELRYEVLP